MTRSHKALSKNNCRNDTKIEKMKRWMCQSARWWWRDLNISLAFSRKGPCAATHALVILESIPCTSGVGSKQNMNFLWWAPFSAFRHCCWELTHRKVILFAAKLHQSAVSKTGTLDWSHYYYLRCRERVLQHLCYSWCHVWSILHHPSLVDGQCVSIQRGKQWKLQATTTCAAPRGVHPKHCCFHCCSLHVRNDLLHSPDHLPLPSTHGTMPSLGG